MSMKQLINRRLIHRISQEALAEKMDCSHQWVSILEGLATGANAEKWETRYEEAIMAIIEEKKSK